MVPPATCLPVYLYTNLAPSFPLTLPCVAMNPSRSPSPTDRELDLKLAELSTQLLNLQQNIRDQQAKVVSDDREIAQMKKNLVVVMEGHRKFLKPEAYQALLRKLPLLK